MSATVDDSAALDEIKELCTFVGHPNAQVRLQMTDVKEISREVFKSLINLAESEELYAQMLTSNLISISMEILRDQKTDLEMRELILMFLVNMTRDEKGASVIMQVGEEVEGLHVRRLVNWFVQFVPNSNNKSQLDPNAYCAHILTNISQLPAGRRLIMNPAHGFLPSLKPQFQSSNTTRRVGCFNLIKNCFMEEENHAALLSKEVGLWASILEPIIGNEPFLHGESEYEGILPEVRAMMTHHKRRDPDPALRVIVYEIILLCARYKPSRLLLKSQAIYPILRHAHDYEKELVERELDELLEQLVPFFLLDEDDEQHPDQIESEKKKARIEQVKQLNQKEDETKVAAAAAAVKKPAVEPVDQPVHYLGDELGGEVRKREAKAATDSSSTTSSTQSIKATASLPPTQPLDDNFPAIEPLGAEETAQLGELTHNIKTLSVAQSEHATAAHTPNKSTKEVVYAQAESVDEEEEEEDAPPPLAEDEDRYMASLD